MFTKIHLAFYNMLFNLYGKLGLYYHRKAKEVDDKIIKIRMEGKALRCIDKREDILDIMFTLKGLS